jgi:hypothetical protein
LSSKSSCVSRGAAFQFFQYCKREGKKGKRKRNAEEEKRKGIKEKRSKEEEKNISLLLFHGGATPP